MEAEISTTADMRPRCFDRSGLPDTFGNNWDDRIDQDDTELETLGEVARVELGEPLDSGIGDFEVERSWGGNSSDLEVVSYEIASAVDGRDASQDFIEVLDNGDVGIVDGDPGTSQNEADAAFQSQVAASQSLTERLQQLRELSLAAQSGDETAVIEIHQMLETSEDLWRGYGDVQMLTEGMLIDVLSVGRREIEECIRRNLAAMKTELLGERPTLLERMSVGRVVLCWLFTQLVDRSSLWSVRQGGAVSGLGKLQESAEKRYQTAIKTLRLVQKLRQSATVARDTACRQTCV